MRKGQIEIAGLLIIVVLVSLVLFFILSFNLREEAAKDPVKQELRDAHLRDRFGPVLLETSTDCDGRTIKELISACVLHANIVCDTKNPCEYVNDTIEILLGKTFDKLGHSYVLEISAGSNVITQFESGCEGKLNAKTARTPFSTEFGSMLLLLKQCS